jgi:hypothetical protein
MSWLASTLELNILVLKPNAVDVKCQFTLPASRSIRALLVLSNCIHSPQVSYVWRMPSSGM